MHAGIGCAGEIKVSQDADYDKWAIDILVKFRDDEKLQLLTGERQSGGVSRAPVKSCIRSNNDTGTFVNDDLIPDELNGACSCTLFVG